MNKNLIIVGVAAAVIFGAGGFFGGMKYQQSKVPARFANFQGARNGNGNTDSSNARNSNFRPVNGQIISADDKSITVKMQDGSSKIVLFSDQTQINQATAATKGDLKTGETVAVFGTANSDGSVTAQSIQLNPQEFRGGANPSPTP
jgi:hypothetical protein